MALYLTKKESTKINSTSYVKWENSKETDFVYSYFKTNAQINKISDNPIKYEFVLRIPIINSLLPNLFIKRIYLSALKLVNEKNCDSVCIPLYNNEYPFEFNFNIAINSIKEFLEESDLDIYLVVPEITPNLSLSKFKDLNLYIDSKFNIIYEQERVNSSFNLKQTSYIAPIIKETLYNNLYDLDSLEDSFSVHLLKLIDLKNVDDVAVYKKANIDRKLFSKIRSNIDYQPSKNTAIALAIALELDLDETQSLLNKAGYSLTRSSRFDLIVMYFIEKEIYDVFDLNEALYTFNERTLN